MCPWGDRAICRFLNAGQLSVHGGFAGRASRFLPLYHRWFTPAWGAANAGANSFFSNRGSPLPSERASLCMNGLFERTWDHTGYARPLAKARMCSMQTSYDLPVGCWGEQKPLVLPLRAEVRASACISITANAS
jgi:hypothetical protein